MDLPNGRLAGFKLRCGGVTAEAVPSASEVALTLATCRDAVVPIKATAGLHHPIRHFDETVQTKMYGFFNLFGAGILAYAHKLTAVELEPILVDEEPDHFQFEDYTFAWQERTVSGELIEQVRQRGLISYGSCSFDEPREDLQALGWL
jgi:hypothetical protein